MSDKAGDFAEAIERNKTNLTELMDGLKKTSNELSELNTKFNDEYNKVMNSVSEKERHKSELEVEKDKLSTEKQILEDDLKQIQSQIATLDEENNSKEKEISELESKVSQLKSDIETKSASLEVAKKELHLKTEAMDNLLKSIEEDVGKALKRVEDAENEAKMIPERNIGTSFLLSRGLEGPSAPKAEIITIVASEEPISTDEIKQKVTSISPVQVSRFIMMLEADGKIHSTEDGKWSLNKEFLSSLGLSS